MSRAALVWTLGVLSIAALLWAQGTVATSAITPAIVVLCFVCELMDSSLGMGYGTTLTPVLLFMGYEPIQLVPTILVSELASGSAAAFFHHREGNVVFRRGSKHLRVAIILSLCSVVGVAAGVQLAIGVSKQVLTLVIGTIILVSGIAILVRSRRPATYQSWKLWLVAAVASFNKAASGGGYGPLVTSGQVVSGVESKAAVAITSLSEAFTCLVGVLLFVLAGKVPTPDLLLPVMAGALLSVPVSASLVQRVPEGFLRRGIAVFTVLFGVLILVKGLVG